MSIMLIRKGAIANKSIVAAGGTPPPMDDPAIVSYHKLDGDLIDAVGTFDGIGTGIAYGDGYFGYSGNEAVAHDLYNKWECGALSTYSFIQNTLEFTILRWVQVDNPTANRQEWIAGNNGLATASKGFAFYYDSRTTISLSDRGLVFFASRGVSGSPVVFIRQGMKLTTGWHLVAVRGNGTIANITVDDQTGADVSRDTLSSGDSTYVLSNGLRGNTDNVGFKGRHDTSVIYNRYLSDQELLDIYNAGQS